MSGYLFGSAGDQALMQPQSLSLREALSLVVPHQSALDLRGKASEHRHSYNRATETRRAQTDREEATMREANCSTGSKVQRAKCCHFTTEMVVEAFFKV